jgi:hypothetical protein
MHILCVVGILKGVRLMNKKLGLKLVSVLMFALLTNSAHASIKGLFKDIFPSGKKIDPTSAMALLRGEFTSAGINLSIDAPLLMGKTSDGNVCSVDVKLLASINAFPDSAAVNLCVGNRSDGDLCQDSQATQNLEASFMIDPEDQTLEVRRLTTPADELDLASVFVQDQNFQIFAGQPYVPTKTVHRSIQVKTDANKKIVSIHMADESTDQTCILN